VIEAYEEEKARSKLPGYVPSYDDFDDDTTWAPPVAPAPPASPPTEVPKIQAPEKPRGPHRPPGTPRRRPRPETRANDRFGEGIFE
jgi:hypothetical protein